MELAKRLKMSKKPSLFIKANVQFQGTGKNEGKSLKQIFKIPQDWEISKPKQKK
jgi:hypothetical protein